MCLLGFWGNHTSLHRPAIRQHVSRRAEQQRKRLVHKTQSALLKMRTNVNSGRQALDSMSDGLRESQNKPSEGTDSSCGVAPVEARQDTACCGQDASLDATLVAADGGAGQADYAYNCYSQAVHILKVCGLTAQHRNARWSRGCAACDLADVLKRTTA